MNAELEKSQAEEIRTEPKPPEKATYVERIKELPAEDQAFMDGYLFAIVKNGKKGA